MLVKRFKTFMLVPIAIVIIAVVVGFISGGLNTGIDFTGGSIITIDMKTQFNSDEVREAVSQAEAISGDVSVVSSGDELTTAIVRIQETGDEGTTDNIVESIMTSVNATWPDASFEGRDSVGGVASRELIMNAIFSVLVACVLMLIYIWIRFDVYSGIGAVCGLLVNVVIMISAMSIFQVSLGSSFIAACLTIVGYAINDTVVVFDRIRENLSKMGTKNHTRAEICDVSVKETLGRTINTTVTTLIMVVSLYIFGVQEIKEFIFPIIIGLFCGTLCSIFVSSPIWMILQGKFAHKKHKNVHAVK